MSYDSVKLGVVPSFSRNAPLGLAYPLNVNALRGMTNPLGMLYGKVRNGGTTWHHGWDLYAEPNTPTYAIDEGTVTQAWDSGNGPGCYGKQVVVELSNVRADGGKVFYHAAHLNGWIVQNGQKVSAGQMLGVTGTTGNADIAAPHLHFELRRGLYGSAGRLNPADYFPDLYAAYLNAVGLSSHVMTKW